MKNSWENDLRHRGRMGSAGWLSLITLAVTIFAIPSAPWAPAPVLGQAGTAARRAGENLQDLEEPPAVPEEANADGVSSETPSLNLLQLVWTARWLMLPIVLMSIIVVAVGIERMFALRRSAIIPKPLVEEILRSTATRTALKPRELFHIAGENPSPASTVIQAVLLKMGRPHGEVERVASETMQRESERMYRNVRTLNLAAAVTPLMGLLGTVWGMIQAFFATANLPVGANKAESLAEGIYTALVTTAGGLLVAIPAAILAHMFEGRIQRLFTDIHELVYTRLMPHAERMEGRTAVPRRATTSAPTPPTPPPVKERVPFK